MAGTSRSSTAAAAATPHKQQIRIYRLIHNYMGDLRLPSTMSVALIYDKSCGSCRIELKAAKQQQTKSFLDTLRVANPQE